MQRFREGFLQSLVGLWLIFILSACQEPTAVLLEPLPTGKPAEKPQDLGQIGVYFSEAGSPTADSYRGGADEVLTGAIDQARFRVDLAVYDLDLWSIRDALVRAHQRGVTVRVVVESDRAEEAEIEALRSAGIPVVGDQRRGLMHQKFVIIDQRDVWTGSMNFTLRGVYRNDNHLIHFRSPSLAENYTVEFMEMFEDQLFGDRIRDNTPHPKLEIQGGLVETYFSPDDHPQKRIIELIQGAEDQIKFLAYSFTSDPIAQAMIRCSERGVLVQGVIDTSQLYSEMGSEWERLKKNGVDVRKDGNPEKMHHKFILIDGEIVIMGSYNFTESAEKVNDENVLIIHNAALGDIFDEEFQRVYRKGYP